MSEQLVECPYCGCKISNDIEKCPECGEFFVEPCLKEFKLVSIPLFLSMETLLSVFGLPFFYSLVWIIINYKNICDIAANKDLKKFKYLLSCFCVVVFLTVIIKFFILIDVIVEIMLVYRILRIIEKYTLRKYNSPVTHHEVGMILFRTLYVIYYIDTYLVRVKDPKLRYCLNVEKWFNYFVILAIIILLLYFLGLISIPMIKI